MRLNRHMTKCANRAVLVLLIPRFVPARWQTRVGAEFTTTGARPLKKTLSVLIETRL